MAAEVGTTTRPSLDEIVETVQRLERRLERSRSFVAYRRLCPRFEADLADARDVALAKSAALMLVKQLAEEAKEL